MERILKFKFILLFSFIFLFFSCASIKQREYFVPDAPVADIENYEKVIRIVQISDLHSNDYGENQSKLISKIKAAEPDLVFFTGDIFDFEWPVEKAVANVEKVIAAVSEICPFYYISGNHEYYLGHDNEYEYLFSDYGGTVLQNRAVQIEIKNVNIVIAGVFDPIATIPLEERISDGVDLETFKINLDKTAIEAKSLNGDLTILLAHRPEFIDLYKAPGIYDLILSGHAHGGQWRFPFINGLYAPGQGLFPKYAGGRYVFESENNKPSVFIISRGLSYQKPMFPRFGNPVELVEILVDTEAFRK